MLRVQAERPQSERLSRTKGQRFRQRRKRKRQRKRLTREIQRKRERFTVNQSR